MNSYKKCFLIIVLVSISHSLAFSQSNEEIRVRPLEWAQPVLGCNLDNFYKVSDNLYRSAQPDEKDLPAIMKLGIREILNLRLHHKDEYKESERLNISFYEVPMKAQEISTKQIVAALRIIKDAKTPLLVHCWHGADRTGMLIAMYRIIFQGWTKEQALDELMNGGFNYHSNFKNIPYYIMNKADIIAIKKAVFSP